MSNLRKAAQDIIEDVDSPYIPDEIRMVDVKLIEALRQAVQDAEVYTPMTDDDRRKIMQEFIEGACSYKTLALNVERAIIERLGLRWPE